jgi:hypothetical protein
MKRSRSKAAAKVELSEAEKERIYAEIVKQKQKTRPSEKWADICDKDVYYPRGKPAPKPIPKHAPVGDVAQERAEMSSRIKQKQEERTAEMLKNSRVDTPWIFKCKSIYDREDNC